MDTLKNTGLNLEREKQEQSPEDWVFRGATTFDEIDYKKYLPQGERQFGAEDFMDCVARSFNNIAETDFNYFIWNKKNSQENIDWLEEKRYITYQTLIDGEVEFSDAFLAIKSGTDRQGNSLKSAPETARKVGLIPKSMLPANSTMTFDDYHNPARITKEMEDLGQEFLKRFSINYEKIYPKDYDKTAIHTAGFAWGNIINKVYQRTENGFNHAFMRFPISKAFDNYIDSVDGDFIKDLAHDYKLMPYSYRIIIVEKRLKKVEESAKIRDTYWQALKRFLELIGVSSPQVA